MAEALDRGAAPFPILTVTWTARSYSLGTGIYSPALRPTAAGPVGAITQPGGWAPIVYGSGIAAGVLEAVQKSVGVADPQGEILRMLETYDPRGSAAAIDWAAPGLAVADWEPVFRGVVSDWARTGLYTRLILKTDDTVLRTPVPSRVFSKTEWGAAADSTIFGTAMPLVFGIHDSFAITTRGMVPAVNIRYDVNLGYWYLASIGHMIRVRRLYYDGIAQPDSGWTTVRGVYGGNLCTIIAVTEGYQPEKGVVVSFDCEGPDDSGGYSGSSVTNPVAQLRAILQEYVYRTPPLGAWVGDHAIIDDDSWDAAEAWFDDHGYESARRLGGDQNPQSAAELVATFLDAHPWARIHWTPRGTLAFVVLDPDDADPTADAWFEVDKHHEGGLVEYSPGDRREVYTHVKVPMAPDGN